MKRIAAFSVIALLLLTQTPQAGAIPSFRSTCESLLSAIGISPRVRENYTNYTDPDYATENNDSSMMVEYANRVAADARNLVSTAAQIRARERAERHKEKELEWASIYAQLPAALSAAIKDDENLRMRFETHIEEAKNPYTLEGALNTLAVEGKLSGVVINKMAAFVYLSGTTKAGGDKLGEKFARWIQSHDEASFVYANLTLFFPKDVAAAIFKELREKNIYFSTAHTVAGVPGALQTFAFEKESQDTELVAMLWRNTKFTDEEWFKLTPEQRANQLYDTREAIPTALGSLRLGKLARETAGGWEAKTAGLDLLFERTRDSIRQITKAFKETHSIHIHQVLMLERHGIWNSRFKVWHKMKADELTIRGLEEGLHPTYLVGILARPDNDNEIETDKMNTIGIRQGIYGLDRSGFIKVGLEYRDSTRNLDRLFAMIEQNAREIEQGIWMNEKFPSPHEYERRLFYLRGDVVFDLQNYHSRDDFDEKSVQAELQKKAKLLSDLGFPDSLIHRLRTNADDMATLDLALTEFENASYFDTKKMKYYRATGTQAHRFQLARSTLLDDLRKVAREYNTGRRAGNEYEMEDIQGAIKMCISDWAKAARVSELFDR